MKRGLSTIVSTLLILLLVFVAVGILWVVVRNVIQGGTEQVSLGKFTLDLAIEKVTIAGNTLSVKVKRNPGAGTFTGLNFILNDGDDIEVIQIKNLTMEEYSVRTFQLTLQEISAGNVEKVEIAPIFTLESGKEVVGDVKDTYTISKDTGTPYVPPVENCNNGLIDAGEDCDGTNISSSDTCLSEGYDGGTLACSSSCAFDYGSCILESCPDGTIDTGEQCDCGADASCTSTELNSQTCSSYLGTGYSGTLGCSQTSCQFVTTSCTYTPTCGDSLNETGEQCDDGGTSSGDGCSSTCTIESGWTCSGGSGQSSCTEIVTEECGNNVIDGDDVCDGTDLGGETCASQMGTGYTGTLSCESDCSGYITTACVPPSGPEPWETGLVSWWTLNTDASDSVGSNDGTVSGATHLTSGCQYGGGCYSFDGTDDRIAIPDDTTLQSFSAFTYSCWLKSETSSTVDRYFVLKDFPNLYIKAVTGIRIIVRHDQIGDGISDFNPISENLNDKAWHHVVFVWDGSNTHLYVDGNHYIGEAATGTMDLTGGNLYIGDGSSLGDDWLGLIDEPMIWNRALSSSEVSDLYNYFS